MNHDDDVRGETDSAAATADVRAGGRNVNDVARARERLVQKMRRDVWRTNRGGIHVCIIRVQTIKYKYKKNRSLGQS